MFNNLTLIQRGDNHYLDSREVAALIGKRHDNLLRDIRNYIDVIRKKGLLIIEDTDFFIESNYVNDQNKIMPRYLIRKAGAEIIANKLTGDKGILFTVAYVSRFNAMEAHFQAEREKEQLSKPTLADCNSTAKVVVPQLTSMGVSTEKVIGFLNDVYKPLGLTVTDEQEFIDIPYTFTASQIARTYGMYSLYGRPHAMAVSGILNENIFISNEHKISVSANYEIGIAGGFRYDEYALEEVGGWLAENDFPNEIYGFDRTYHVIYSI